jgi:hypothetical protein
MIEDFLKRVLFEGYQRGHALRAFSGNGAGKQSIRHKQGFNMRPDLRQKARCPRLGRLAEEHSAKSQAAADRFLDSSKSLNRAFAIGQFGIAKRLAQYLNQRIVASLNPPQAAGNRTFRTLQILAPSAEIIRASRRLASDRGILTFVKPQLWSPCARGDGQNQQRKP